MTRDKERNSNIELLRIIAMIMILGYHFIAHGVINITSEDKYVIWSNGSLINSIASSLFTPGGGIGVGVFFIISGFFNSNKTHINIKRTASETVFYSVILTLAYICLKLSHISFSSLSISESLLICFKSLLIPITSGEYWFVLVYLIITILAPLINPYLQRVSSKGFLIIVIAWWVFWYSAASLGAIFFPLERGLFFYVLGAYLKRITSKQSSSKGNKYLIALVIIWTMGVALNYYLGMISVGEFSLKNQLLWKLIQLIITSVIDPLGAVFLFLAFATRSFKANKCINTVGKCTFGVYLLHDSPLFRDSIWHYLLRTDSLLYFSKLFPVYSLLLILLLYAVLTTIDYLRLRFLEDKIIIFSDKIISRMKKILL